MILWLIPSLLAVACSSEEIISLPGLKEKPKFKHFSGYVNASETHYLFYWLTESESDPSKDPFVVWFNGGPGCSALGGLLSEQGPFHIKDDGKSVYLNKYAWNKEANVLFLEAPAGVGFSYSAEPSDIVTGDDKTASENYEALKNFFTRYPKYRKLDLFITGESYGGIYVPTLVSKILQGQAAFPMNLKGMAIGNGLVDRALNEDSTMQFAYAHGLVDQKYVYEGVQSFFLAQLLDCQLVLRLWGMLQSACCRGCTDFCPFHLANSSFCQYHVAKIILMSWTDFGLNVYDLYRDCYHPRSSALDNSRYRADVRGLAPKAALSLLDGGSNLRRPEEKRGKTPEDTNDGVPICLNGTAYTMYLRLPEVRKTLGIPAHVDQWKDCSDKISLTYHKEYDEVSKLVKQALAANIRVLLYYGDTDMMCNFLMGQRFSENLNLPLVSSNQPWKYKDQIAGFVTRYKGLDYLTVKGSGHMVPEWRAPESLQMITKFLRNQPY